MGFSTVDRVKTAFFRRHSDGSGPILLDRRRIYLLPTAAGLLYAVMLLTMLLAAINYNLALGHLLVFLLLALGLNTMLHSFRNLHRLRLTPGRCAPAFAGESVHFPLWIEADDDEPRLALEVSSAGQLLLRLEQCSSGGDWLMLPIGSQVRGWLPLPRLKLGSRYPLGLFIAWSNLQPEMRALIYPAPRHTPLPPPRENTGEQGSGDDGLDDFAGFRDRQPADSPRHVAWRASSRQVDERPLLVKQFAGGSHPEYLFDWNDCLPADDETRLSQLCGWVLAADAAGNRYGLRLPNRIIDCDRGSEHRQRCLEALALYPAGSA